MTIVVSIVALCVVIIIHEFGHYLAAVWTGMKVDRFSVFGIGPSILYLGTWRGTRFQISAIPFGAYVLIRGMEPEDPQEAAENEARTPEEKKRSHNFRDKPMWARALVLAGGPFANYLAAMAILLAVFVSAGVRGPHEHLVVQEFGAESSAQDAGMEVGDEIVAIGGEEIEPARGVRGVNALTTPRRGTATDITVRRDDALVTLSVELPEDKGKPALGVGFQTAPRHPVGFGEATTKAVSEPITVTKLQLQGLWKLITGKTEAEVSGPVGIVEHISKQAKSGLIPFLTTTAFISTLLGMFNLLPLPALDGGRLSFLAYEAVARRRASARIEEAVHAYGMLALLALLALVTVGDIRRLF